MLTTAACHVYQRQTRFHPAAGLPAGLIGRGRELWILHPGGEPLPATFPAREQPQPTILVLDGTWRQAAEMLRACERTGRRVRLADGASTPGRYWLRNQPRPGHLSTIEAVMGILQAGGEAAAERLLRLHFELHVYASLLARGRRDMAERYLGHSPLLSDAPHVLDTLHDRRRRGRSSGNATGDTVPSPPPLVRIRQS